MNLALPGVKLTFVLHRYQELIQVFSALYLFSNTTIKELCYKKLTQPSHSESEDSALRKYQLSLYFGRNIAKNLQIKVHSRLLEDKDCSRDEDTVIQS